MKSKRPDLKDTQELNISKDKLEYGDGFNTSDNFDRSTSNNTEYKKQFHRNLFFIYLIAPFCILIVVIIFLIVSCNSSNKITNEISNTSPSSIHLSTLPTKNNKKIEETHKEKTSSNSEETFEIQNTTEEITEVITEEATEEATEETTIQNTQTTEIPVKTEDEKIFSVSNIIVSKDSSNTFIAYIIGEFSGYTAQELLEKISVSVSSGTPNIYNPKVSGDTLTFNINLNECEGTLSINADLFNYYSKIDII